VQQYNIKTRIFSYDIKLNNSFPDFNNKQVTALEVDLENNIWIGTHDGLIFHSINGENATQRISQINGLAGNSITCLFCDMEGKLWVGSSGNGLTLIQDAIFTRIDIGGNFTPMSICEDRLGIVWIGTDGYGLLKCEDREITGHSRSNQGLLSDYITLVDVDEQNNLWIGSNRGLNKLIRDENKFFTYTKKNGFIGIEVKRNASLLDSDGNMWFGTVKGAIREDSENESVNILEPLTSIKRIMVNLKEREMTQSLSLKYRENSIIFEYAGICFTNPDVVQYKVMLEGADESWRPATSQSFVNYSQLAPGDYCFKVMACNNLGDWNANPVTFSFRITPPFYQTTWFYTIIGVVFIMSLYLYIRIRERNLVNEKRVLEEKVAERTEEVVARNAELARKNKDILDSITYAQRIQSAILEDEAKLYSIIPGSFVFYHPKAIVSGDFYWFSEKNDQAVIVAADCTGHGIPGAFMSMLGIAHLKEIVGKATHLKANEILYQLRKQVIDSLHQTGSENEAKDGMDLALIIYDKKRKYIQYAGAHIPLYIVHSLDKPIRFNNERSKEESQKNIADINRMLKGNTCLSEVKANRMPIGYHPKLNKPFTNHEIQLSAGDIIYLTTDGLADQFGGPNDKRYTSRKLKESLLEINQVDIKKHKEILYRNYLNWKGNEDQLDDIMMIGLEV